MRRMIGSERWRSNWRIVSRPGSVRLDLGRSARRRQAAFRTVRDLPAGAGVVLCASAPGAAGRCRAFAAQSGLELEREYLAFPSAVAPAYLVEDAAAPVGVFVKAVLVTPPGIRFPLPIDAGLAFVRALSPWRLVRTLAPGRVVVARRP
jgi:hypothetical protein